MSVLAGVFRYPVHVLVHVHADVFSALRQRPLRSLKQICSDTGTTFPTASKAMQTLVTLGIATNLTGQRRNRVFVYSGYLNILNEGGEPL